MLSAAACTREIGDGQRWSAERLVEVREAIAAVFAGLPEDAVAIRTLAYLYVVAPSREKAWQFFVSLRGGGSHWIVSETTCFGNSDAWRKSLHR